MATSSTAAPARVQVTRADGSPIRALVVDDEPSLGELLCTVLRYEGWQVETAMTGQAAIRAARSLDPDVILLDIMLPDLDGIEVLRRIRMTQPNVPVLFLTAKDAVEDRVAGLTAGGRRLCDQAVQPRGGGRASAGAAAPCGGDSGARGGDADRRRSDHG